MRSSCCLCVSVSLNFPFIYVVSFFCLCFTNPDDLPSYSELARVCCYEVTEAAQWIPDKLIHLRGGQTAKLVSAPSKLDL
jgi:hypothetical protein